MTHLIITISRQLGSGGSYIGQEVARELKVRYLDREILGEAARILKEDPTILAGREERISSFLEDFFRTLSLGMPDSGYLPPTIPIVYDRHIFAVEAEIIRGIARTECAVIVGRGGYHILRGHPALLNVFLHAPTPVRVRRVRSLYQVGSEKDAAAMVADSDRDRRRFNERMTGEKWTDALNFDLCIDTESTGYEVAVKTIVAAALKRHPFRGVRGGAQE